MKKYVKPKFDFEGMLIKDQITSLNSWLSENGLENVGIITYVTNS